MTLDVQGVGRVGVGAVTGHFFLGVSWGSAWLGGVKAQIYHFVTITPNSEGLSTFTGVHRPLWNPLVRDSFRSYLGSQKLQLFSF